MTRNIPLSPTTVIPDFRPLATAKLSLKIADTADEIMAAQRLRYDVFYNEMHAVPSAQMLAEQREIDSFDACCEHLLVIDNSLPAGRQVVGTYRIMNQDQADNGFYTETEFNIDRLRSQNGKIMEISRSCVIKTHRDQTVINLLWRGIAAYILENNIDYLIGIPSLEGTDWQPHLETLRYLQTHHLARDAILPFLRPEFANDIDLKTSDKTTSDRHLFARLPPLIKGYLRVGGVVGQGAFIDRQFNTVDVCIVWEVNNASRYLDRFRP